MSEINYTQKLCSVEGCLAVSRTHGLCPRHYSQKLRGGIKQRLTNCVLCNEKITSNLSNAIYCGKECKRKAYVNKVGKDVLAIRYKQIPRSKRLCSVSFNNCIVCNKNYVSKRKSYICSDACYKNRLNESLRIKYKNDRESKSYKCKHCAIAFTTQCYDKRKSFCSSKCSKKYAHSITPRKVKDRALKYGVYYEYVNKIKVFDRDGWLCQICGVKTPKNIMGKHKPNSPELDHRIPMSLGGEHSYNNVQCSCRQCNGTKSNKNTIGQYPLFAH